MRPNPKFIIIASITALFCLALLFYIYHQSRDFLNGPYIKIESPLSGGKVFGPEIEVRGILKRTLSAKLNDNPLLISTDGKFNEKLILSTGYNIIKIEAKDRFGKEIVKKIEFIVVDPEKL
jgi:hypothetical protein